MKNSKKTQFIPVGIFSHWNPQIRRCPHCDYLGFEIAWKDNNKCPTCGKIYIDNVPTD